MAAPKKAKKAPANPKVSAKAIKAPKAPKAPKVTVTQDHIKEWKENMPVGQGTQAWRDWGKARPGRASRASATLRDKSVAKAPDKPLREAASEAWQSERPQGGGRGIAASSEQWKAWGASNPNRKPIASRALSDAKKAKNAPKTTEAPDAAQ